MSIFRSLLLLFVLQSVALVAAQRSNSTSPWQTLTGNAPLVIARGGFSGLFPDSSLPAYNLALLTSLQNVIVWCDVQLTKDGAGICLPDLNLANYTMVSSASPDKSKEYLVNGVPEQGWFSVDYTLDGLTNINLIQGVLSRSSKFDFLYPILTVEDVAFQVKPPSLWLNIQHDAFFRQHNLSMRSYVLSISRRVVVSYVSSPEVDFLRSIVTRFKGTKTKLIFRYLGAADDTEPSTNQTYGSLLKNLTFVKTFASGIILPKNYIWPVDAAGYLQPHTSIVSDAHKEGLEVFASDFANDATFSYDYSYDPINEYLSFIDNGNFSVDGVLSDFPITPSEAIDCFSHISKNSSTQATPTVISHNGASGMYPGCTNLAYQQAVEDGADFIDCAVQMTKDGTPICLGSINLISVTTAAQSKFSSRSILIPEIQDSPGIFTFNLTWAEVQELKPAILNPFIVGYNLFRNPINKNVGEFMSLADFLAFAKNKTLSGVVIKIEHAAYLAEKEGLSIIDKVLDALKDSGYNNHTTQKVIIQSSDSSVLVKLKEQTSYKLTYYIKEDIQDALNSSIGDIKKFADNVAISRPSIFPDNQAFLIGVTNIVEKLHSFNLSVYVFQFRNEFVSQPWDFFSDPTVEINSYVMATEIDGVITDFPATAVAYRRNRCLKMKKTPVYMDPVQPGSLLQIIPLQSLPPAEAPLPVLTETDVIEPPLPAVSTLPSTNVTVGSSPAPAPPPPPSPNGQQRNTVYLFQSSLVIFLGYLLLF